jgi:hypothetical protein
VKGARKRTTLRADCWNLTAPFSASHRTLCIIHAIHKIAISLQLRMLELELASVEFMQVNVVPRARVRVRAINASLCER